MSLVFLTDKSGQGTSATRGVQIAEYLGAKLDPLWDDIGAEDVVVVVKGSSEKYTIRNILRSLKRTEKVFCDINDCSRSSLEKELTSIPGITLITQTPTAVKLIEERIPNHKVIWIPHHHCNYENTKRPNRPVNTIVFNGRKQGFPSKYASPFKYEALREGFTVIRSLYTVTRETSCEVYAKADISISFRKDFTFNQACRKNSLKIHNAGSFRVPTVAYPEIGFVKSYGDPNCFIHVETVGEMLEQCIRLRDDPIFYNKMAGLAEEDAAKYHISKVAEWYRRLLV